MKLHWSPRSPFVRKVMIVLHETGLTDRVECVRSVVAFSAPPNEAVLTDTPLGKIPTLVLDDGTSRYDSRVIAEYLDGLHDGPKLFPAEPDLRFRQLCWLALADGMTDILLLWRNERTRPSGPYDVHLTAFETKIRAAFGELERQSGAVARRPFGIGQIAVICMLGQMDFRFAGSEWEKAHPGLASWYRTMEGRRSVAATAIRDDSAPSPASQDDSRSPFTF
ncbi:MAG TPA: glutathione S-transferase N-terminal domain-containing protein [Pararhizobium sp.]|nr:glutathione S-transferase N-terminal domain-containing protein [Pararhizobium sp.]